MFRKFLGNQYWNSVIRDNPDDNFLKEFVEDFFKKDNIDPTKFWNNFNVAKANLYSTLMYDSDVNDFSLTKNMKRFKYVSDRPLGLEPWFIAAYPDISAWIADSMENYINQYPFAGIFDHEDNFIEHDAFKPWVLRIIVDYYKRNINRKLECGI